MNEEKVHSHIFVLSPLTVTSPADFRRMTGLNVFSLIRILLLCDIFFANCVFGKREFYTFMFSWFSDKKNEIGSGIHI